MRKSKEAIWRRDPILSFSIGTNRLYSVVEEENKADERERETRIDNEHTIII